MPDPQQLASALENLKSLQDLGRVAIRSKDLSQTERQLLVDSGFLQRVMKGWYVASQPDDQVGDTTPWYSSFWSFCAQYFNDKYGDQWSLSAEQSISLHVGNQSIPKQVLVRTPRGGDKSTTLLHGTSVYDLRGKVAPTDEIGLFENLRLYKLPAALIEAVPIFFSRNATDARAALTSFNDASLLLPKLLEGRRSTIAGRLCGAFRNVGRDDIADEIKKAMTAGGHEIRESDPFDEKITLDFGSRAAAPQAARIRLMWQAMREEVIKNFPASPGPITNSTTYLERVDDVYKTDAYHSLSIEGYRVSQVLIEKVRNQQWDPDNDDEDRKHQDALAARGYHLAFEVVKKSVKLAVLDGKNAGEVARRDHGDWYREMFAPLVSSGVLTAGSLAGYRNGRVFIKGSRHVPIYGEAVSDVMPVFFELLENEANAAVRVVLGHFVFVYIHPYSDGNGRCGRFLMNLMLASGGYPWTVIPVEQLSDYMESLELASVIQNIIPFTQFLGRLVMSGMEGNDIARLPDEPRS